MNGKKLKALRQARGWTQAELARRAHLPAAHISQIESGTKNNLTWNTLAGLATALELSIDQLVARLSEAPMASASAA